MRITARSLREWRAATPVACLALLAALIEGCAPRPLVERAIRARGGPLVGMVSRIDAQVYVGAPGAWQWTRAFLAPDRYAWVIVTAADPHSHLFDGTTARSFIGTSPVSADAGPRAPLRSHARWTAVVDLDALRAPDVTLRPLPATELPAGAREGLHVTLPDGAAYRLAFDAHALLVWAQGPLDFSPLGSGDATVRFGDFRRTGGLLVPWKTSYALGATPLADETAVAVCVDPPDLGLDAFVAPGRLPACR